MAIVGEAVGLRAPGPVP